MSSAREPERHIRDYFGRVSVWCVASEMLTLDIITHRLTLVWWIFTKVGHDDEWTLLQMSFDVDLRVTFDLHIGVKYAFSL